MFATQDCGLIWLSLVVTAMLPYFLVSIWNKDRGKVVRLYGNVNVLQISKILSPCP